MSSIYIQEPPTLGKVLLKTSVGDIDIELFSKETPKACRNFVQLCADGYYNNTIFHRLVKGFIVQGGDPLGNGTGGESIYGEPFKDEFHSRLRFVRRGLLAMANSGPNDNGSQFFFTLGTTPELQNKHTIFGKVTGDTIYNMLKLEDGLVDETERPRYPHKIVRAEILNNPFEDMVVTDSSKKQKSEKSSSKREKGVKNFGLLSFGAEAEEDEEVTTQYVKQNTRKSKSTHDVLDDPKLSKETSTSCDKRIKRESSSEEEGGQEVNVVQEEKDNDEVKRTTETIRQKLMAKRLTKEAKLDTAKHSCSSDSDEEDTLDLNKEKNALKKKQADKIREEIIEVKKQHKEDKKRKLVLMEKERVQVEEKKSKSELMQEYLDEKDKYSHLKKDLPKKGASREQFTLSLLNKFKSKLYEAKEKASGSQSIETEQADDLNDETWLGHELHFEEKAPVLAKDAATKQDDWYDVYDPRNPINKRRRGEKERTTKK